MVGDWPERDMVGAKQLGIKTIFARYGHVKGQTQSGADYDIDDISELIAVLDKINSDNAS